MSLPFFSSEILQQKYQGGWAWPCHQNFFIFFFFIFRLNIFLSVSTAAYVMIWTQRRKKYTMDTKQAQVMLIMVLQDKKQLGRVNKSRIKTEAYVD